MAGSSASRHLWSSFALALLCFFSPFVAVFLVEGGISLHFGINALLCLCGWIPGILHALTILFSHRRLRIDHRRKRWRMRDIKVPFTGGSKYITIWLPKQVGRRRRTRRTGKKRSLVLSQAEVDTSSRTPSISTTSASTQSMFTTPASSISPFEPSSRSKCVPDHARVGRIGSTGRSHIYSSRTVTAGTRPAVMSHRRLSRTRRSLSPRPWSPADSDHPAAGISMERWIRRTKPLRVLGVHPEP